MLTNIWRPLNEVQEEKYHKKGNMGFVVHKDPSIKVSFKGVAIISMI